MMCANAMARQARSRQGMVRARTTENGGTIGQNLSRVMRRGSSLTTLIAVTTAVLLMAVGGQGMVSWSDYPAAHAPLIHGLPAFAAVHPAIVEARNWQPIGPSQPPLGSSLTALAPDDPFASVLQRLRLSLGNRQTVDVTRNPRKRQRRTQEMATA